MRVDLQANVPAAVAAEAVQPNAGGAGAASRTAAAGATEDTATLSKPGLIVPSLAAQALQAAEARFAKVDALQRAVSSGAYTLDPSLIAEALLRSGL